MPRPCGRTGHLQSGERYAEAALCRYRRLQDQPLSERGRRRSDGPVRFIGAIPNTSIALSKLTKQLAKDNCRLEFSYEPGARLWSYIANGPSSVMPAAQLQRRWFLAGLANLSKKISAIHRSSPFSTDPTISPVLLADEALEAMRDLSRGRGSTQRCSSCARQQCLAFLCHRRIYETDKHRTQRHRRWFAGQTFDQTAHLA